jgi:VanZ family protein
VICITAFQLEFGYQMTMLMNRQRRVLGGLIFWARMAGFLLVVLAVLCLPGMQFVTGRYAGLVDVIASLALLLVGLVWLFGVSMLIRFFDDYLSRN